MASEVLMGLLRILALFAATTLTAACSSSVQRFDYPYGASSSGYGSYREAPSRLGAPARVVVVARGDTLASIARRHQVSAALIRESNRLATDRLVPGQELVVPLPPR
jgi:hypothetical protein